MSEKERVRKKWDGESPVEKIDEAMELLATIKDDLTSEDEGHERYYELIGIKVVYDVDE